MNAPLISSLAASVDDKTHHLVLQRLDQTNTGGASSESWYIGR